MTTTDDVHGSVKRAYDAMNTAWGAIREAQKQMEDAGYPKPVVGLLDDTRLAVSNTAAFPVVVEAIEYIDELIEKHCSGGSGS